jgi:predicted DNA-binding antitoxin AbrB/MazE fold protein
MLKTIKVRYKHGLFEPLEKIDLKEDFEVTIALLESENLSEDGLDESFGGWKGLIDAEELIKNIYTDRLIVNRPEVKL